MNDFFARLGSTQHVRLLCGITLVWGDADNGRRWFGAIPAAVKVSRVSDYVLLGLHYIGHILSRYSRNRSDTYVLAGRLNELVYHIIEDGVWPGSNLIESARVADCMEFRPLVSLPADVAAVVRVALIRPLLSDDISLACEPPTTATEDELILSVVALLQGILPLLDGPAIELLDKSLRYLQSFHEEEPDWTTPGVAQTLANRAFRSAGGDAG